MSQQWSPYTQNGGTMVSISGPDYVLCAADMRQMSGYTIQSRTASKCYEVGDGLVVSCAGCDADCRALIKVIKQKINWYHFQNDNKRMSVNACARMIQGLLYGKRFFPYYCYVILGGLDEVGEGAVYAFDPVGSYERVFTRASGAASSLIMPFLDSQGYLHNQYVPGSNGTVPRERQPIDKEESMRLVRDAFTAAAERQIEVGDYLEIKAIDKNGIQVLTFDLRKD